MAFKFVALCSLLAVANAGVISHYPTTYSAAPAVAVAHQVAYANPSVDAVASTQQNVVRSFGGTVSSYSKAVDTPYSSVRKTDTRVSNNVYTPTIAKTVSYAPAYATPAYVAPSVVKTVSYAAPAPTAAVYTHAAPVVSNSVTYAAPAAPVVYSHAPVAKTISYAAPSTTSYNHGPAATTYTHNAPGLSGYGSSQTVQYSPAEMVSHMSFDGFGTHWGWGQ